MKNIAKEIGITLIALIITIVVLLVLAVTAIGAVKDSGIIEHSQRTATEYELGKEEEGVKLAIMEAKMALIGKTLTGEALTDGLRSQRLDPDRELSETAPFIFKIEDGTGKEYVIMEDGSIGEIKTDAKDWVYTVTETEATITGCNLTDLNNIIIPKHLTQEDGTVLTVTKLGNGSRKIADFSGVLMLPNDVTIERYAFNNCLNIEKIVFGENNTFIGDSGGTHQFTSVNTKLKEVKIGNGSKVEYLTFNACPNIEKVIVEGEVRINYAGFENCAINNIEIKDNVTVEGRAFWNTKNKIQKITIGNNFTSLGKWLEGCTIKDIIIGKNVSLGSHGLSAQSKLSIDKVIIDKTILNVGYFALYQCNISSPNNYIEIIAKDGKELVIGEGALIISANSSIEKIVFDGTDGSIKFAPSNWQVVSTNKTIELKGNINSTVGYGPFRNANDVIVSENAVIGENVISRSKINTLIINKNATISNIGGEVSKVVIKDISQWEDEKLTKVKEFIAASITKTPIEDETLDVLTYTR